jgi:hypothetical protein
MRSARVSTYVTQTKNITNRCTMNSSPSSILHSFDGLSLLVSSSPQPPLPVTISHHPSTASFGAITRVQVDTRPRASSRALTWLRTAPGRSSRNWTRAYNGTMIGERRRCIIAGEGSALLTNTLRSRTACETDFVFEIVVSALREIECKKGSHRKCLRRGVATPDVAFRDIIRDIVKAAARR